jgi:hypothetical protein
MRCHSHLSDDEREQIGLARTLGHSGRARRWMRLSPGLARPQKRAYGARSSKAGASTVGKGSMVPSGRGNPPQCPRGRRRRGSIRSGRSPLPERRNVPADTATVLRGCGRHGAGAQLVVILMERGQTRDSFVYRST